MSDPRPSNQVPSFGSGGKPDKPAPKPGELGYGEGVVDRRTGLDRREIERARREQAESTGLERRRGPGRRLSDFLRDAEEGELNQEQFLFLMAIDQFKRVNGKTFPSWTDVLEVIRLLGYRKTAASELKLPTQTEDWTEKADAPSNVRRVTGGDGEEEE
ncbi:MAG TPA: hypothetical protein VG797_05435 [Phycisphaerales bacterium]|nr:hypothetical protein [Phycisphaerales bacterium]